MVNELKLPPLFAYDFRTRGIVGESDFVITKHAPRLRGLVTVQVSDYGLAALLDDAVVYSDMARWVQQDPDNRSLVLSAQKARNRIVNYMTAIGKEGSQ